MKSKDYLKFIFLDMNREKNNLIYVFAVFILVILSLTLFVYRHNTERFINFSLTKSIGYRSLVTEFRVPLGISPDSSQLKEFMEKDIEELLKIEHVVDAFDSSHWETVVTSDFKNERVDGTITLLRGTPDILPPLVAGRSFEENETGVAICPRYFYPNFEPREIDKNAIIDGYTLLGTDFNIEFFDYIETDNELKINNTYTKNFKIVGIYNSFERINDNGVCYISNVDLEEINDIQSSVNKSGIPLLNIVIDSIENVDEVKDEITKMGFENIEAGAFINKEMVNTIRISFILSFALMLLSVVILTPIYAKWKTKKEEQNIGNLRTFGYSQKIIRNIYSMKILILNFLGYMIGVIIFIIVYFIAVQNIHFLINMSFMLGKLKIGIDSLIFSFLITVILPWLIINAYINKKCKQSIIKLIKD